jgi:hypothetical protein
VAVVAEAVVEVAEGAAEEVVGAEVAVEVGVAEAAVEVVAAVEVEAEESGRMEAWKKPAAAPQAD